MLEVFSRPPNFAEIDAEFNVAGLPVLFCYGDTIYNPSRVGISPSLRAHEAVHSRRQGGNVEGWWRRYIAEPAFRLDEEIPAHVEEYKKFCSDNTEGQGRNARRMALHQIAKRLSSKLYGGLIRYDAARKIIKAAAA